MKQRKQRFGAMKYLFGFTLLQCVISAHFFLGTSLTFGAVPAFRTDRFWLELTEKSKNISELNLFKKEIEKNAASLALQLNQDSHAPGVLEFWGVSQNHDEFAKSKIVNENILDSILAWLGAPKRANSKLVHAGIEHTYGYLFSDLSTAYGYKRARWIQTDIEEGFGLSEGILSPSPQAGTLLKNVTYFAGKIAFRDDLLASNKLQKVLADQVPAQLRELDVKNLNFTRVEEEVQLSDEGKKQKIKITLRTDLVKFMNRKMESEPKVDKNSYLLVYSILDSRLNRPQLITLFPVNGGFFEKLTDPAQLGVKEKIVSRYNAYISGLTDSAAVHFGERKIVF